MRKIIGTFLIGGFFIINWPTHVLKYLQFLCTSVASIACTIQTREQLALQNLLRGYFMNAKLCVTWVVESTMLAK